MLEYVDLAAARERSGTRIVTSAGVPSPWSEAVKGMFAIAELPAVVVATQPRNGDVIAWAGGIDNVPVVLHDHEPPRTNWAAILGLHARLAPGTLVPAAPAERAHMAGLVELVAGEGGLGWTARLVMIHESFATNGERGFPLPVAKYLAKRYGYGRELSIELLRERVGALFATLHAELRAPYFGGERANALDIYAATFLTPLTVIDDSVCPQMLEPVRRAFAAARTHLAELVPETMWAHRARMFERLGVPIRLS